MDFDYSREEETFRQELRTWLTANPPAGYDADTFEQLEYDTRFAVQRNWQRQLYAAGWVGISWPKDYGGRSASIAEQAIYQQEMGRIDTPGVANEVALVVVGPAIIHWGSEEQKQRYIPHILNAEEIWCQGFSERNAGSDFANVQTTAVVDGDHYVVNGQKVWTSFASQADYCMLIARTDSQVPKHRGLSCLLVDMRTPGITLKPLVQINGDPEFSELFLKDVRVPRANLLGTPGDGWQVAMTALTYERASRADAFHLEPILFRLIATARQIRINDRPGLEDETVRQKLSQFHIETQAIKLGQQRQLTRRLRGAQPGPETSISKVAGSELNQRMAHFAMELLGPYSQYAEGVNLALLHHLQRHLGDPAQHPRRTHARLAQSVTRFQN
jgi:alkylation response protein AidB-like acyl-CoA dehydrogenase